MGMKPVCDVCQNGICLQSLLPGPLPVSAAGLATVLYWFWVEMMLERGLRAGAAMRESSSTMLLLRGWFLGNSLSLCSRENLSRSSF